MLASKPVLHISFAMLVWAANLALPRFATAGGGIEALNTATPAVRAERPAARKGTLNGGAARSAVGTCTLGAEHKCFQEPALTGPYVNVGAFFHRDMQIGPRGALRARSSASDIMLKFILNSGPDSVEVVGMSFFSTSGRDVFPAAGVVLTSGDTPYFPRAEQIVNLQQVRIAGRGVDTVVCVDFGSPRVVMPPGGGAWLVLRFPDAAESNFIGVRADTSGVDEPCDFLSPDSGELWYRPDPAHPPFYDWAITGYTRPLTVPHKLEAAWTTMKNLYR